ncbi:MAG TPA: hypothetical protein VJ807_04855 [Gaiellaceae bacterium]|nr:hypothetical protein [Gaiellaceae bacterium]
MSAAGIRALVNEARKVGAEVTAEAESASVGPVAVSGMLAEQLAKELGAGATPGAVVVGGGDLADRAEVLVRVIAGDPTPEDDQLVRAADARRVPVVLIQLWPQADWSKPFVLSPFVVECRAGEGFPVAEIADRIVEATENASLLAARVPAIAEASRAGLVKSALFRSALIALAGSRLGVPRQLLTLEQIRLLLQLRTTSAGAPVADEMRVRAGGAAAVVAAGFAFRQAARSLRTIVPGPVADVAVAVGGTWGLAKALELAESRLLDA